MRQFNFKFNPSLETERFKNLLNTSIYKLIDTNESSLPGIGNNKAAGSILLSTKPIIAILDLKHSFTKNIFLSILVEKTTEGSRVMLLYLLDKVVFVETSLKLEKTPFIQRFMKKN